MRLVSIQAGTPRTFGIPGSEDPMDRVFTSAIDKTPVSGRAWVGTLGLSGDTVNDRRHHGGVDQALLAYAGQHYLLWRREWQRDDVGPGAFGENLTLSDATEDTVCVGDRWQVGEVVFEVTKPREPCATLARRHRRADLIDVVTRNGRSGWYLRVLKEGWIEAGMAVELTDRPYPQWTVRRAAQVMVERASREEEAALLAECPALAANWRERLRKAIATS
jgi:MOSC domain-containing protein YiiM